MQLTAKIRIYPTEEQIEVLWILSEKCQSIYNIALADRKDAWHNDQRSVKFAEQCLKLTEFKKKNPEYSVVYSKVQQAILKKLDANYRSFFALRKNGDYKAKPPNFRSRKYFQTIPYNQSGFKILRTLYGNRIIFSHNVNNISLDFGIDKTFPNIKQVEIFNDDPLHGKGKFFISVVYDVIPEPYVDNGCYQAIDAGITKIVTGINLKGKFHEIVTPRPDKYWQPKIDAIKSRRDHCKGQKKGSKKSRRYLRLHDTYRKMERKKHNQLKDFQHKLSRKMVDNTKANTIIIGKLDVKKMAQSKKLKGKKKKALNRSTQNQGYLSRFIEFLTYKAELIGKRVIKIDESYTSQECCICGKRHNMPLSERIMSCDCGNNIDRDRNSAINIMTKYLLQNALWTSLELFVSNLRQTGLLMKVRFSESSLQMM
jgi:putative transposase